MFDRDVECGGIRHYYENKKKRQSQQVAGGKQTDHNQQQQQKLRYKLEFRAVYGNLYTEWKRNGDVQYCGGITPRVDAEAYATYRELIGPKPGLQNTL